MLFNKLGACFCVGTQWKWWKSTTRKVKCWYTLRSGPTVTTSGWEWTAIASDDPSFLTSELTVIYYPIFLVCGQQHIFWMFEIIWILEMSIQLLKKMFCFLTKSVRVCLVERVVVLPYHMVRQFSTTGCVLVFWGLEVSTSNSQIWQTF